MRKHRHFDQLLSCLLPLRRLPHRAFQQKERVFKTTTALQNVSIIGLFGQRQPEFFERIAIVRRQLHVPTKALDRLGNGFLRKASVAGFFGFRRLVFRGLGRLLEHAGVPLNLIIVEKINADAKNRRNRQQNNGQPNIKRSHKNRLASEVVLWIFGKAVKLIFLDCIH